MHQTFKGLGNNSTDLGLAYGQRHVFFKREPWQTFALIAADRFLVRRGFLHGETALTAPATSEKFVAAPAATPTEKAP